MGITNDQEQESRALQCEAKVHCIQTFTMIVEVT